ncbi:MULTISPECIES: hypothetical protein [unclassified Methylobacterium]|uniref:hypothetical protein n=1 Tax=unclassified Methylobacterium TaxID=2615210 RepID=UPI001FB91DDD|nr:MULTISPECIES: hypothetical protein [unclassified Methylobacterium]MCJ2094547.1 hypothetical protein [Methylobacterium sp. J-072]MCJ2141595.1 hypothetical protein [Methylobacterium sp. E-066]
MARSNTRCGNVQTVAKTWKNDAFNALCPVLQGSLDPQERRRVFRQMLEIYDVIDPPGTALHDLTMFYGKAKAVSWQAYPVEVMDFRAGNRV